jgi:hypothetical protein
MKRNRKYENEKKKRAFKVATARRRAWEWEETGDAWRTQVIIASALSLSDAALEWQAFLLIEQIWALMEVLYSNLNLLCHSLPIRP